MSLRRIDDEPHLALFPIPGLVRRGRRIARMSQREMARLAKVSPALVGSIESGRCTPSLAVLQRLLGVAGLFLIAVDMNGYVVQPLEEYHEADGRGVRDAAGRRYPAHLDLIIDPVPGEWWGDIYGLQRPPETFHRRSRKAREAQRRRSQESVRRGFRKGTW
ncbi:helix-turn-helix domain-containing protein [Actinoallomurus soli]|uniref:helix-turn-helix domain-containing protein n=1 Tax=Actinoallomurus soli TaxID=2952535 RepID=UPI002092E3B0|nr:helix-turn-helix transcriptional regulator [Actinoallomurus soli]MCO5972087.1 helix-turn-helix domain-containing protein [Actinoallomurus soli]